MPDFVRPEVSYLLQPPPPANGRKPAAESRRGPHVRPVCRLHHLFERQCDRAPDAPALVCGAERLSYAGLEARANRLARLLASHGVRPGDRVGILLERSVETYASLLAVLKCGAAFVPIDPSSPPGRVAFVAEDSALALLLTTTGFAAATSAAGCPVLALDTAGAALAGQAATRPQAPDRGDALCYIIYTSGSTGRPKGVAVNHSSACNFLSVCTPTYGVTAADRVYQGMTVAFDFSIEEIWPTFAVGATLVAGPTDHRRFGPGLADFLTEQGITVLYCVPTLLATLDHDVPSLRALLVGGEACPRDLVRRWSRPGRRMLNTYGPTETTVTCTWAELTPDRPVTIGRPLPTYRVYLLDESLRRVPDGEAGEICVGGPGVAQGYVNRPDLTALRFVADPIDPDAGGRVYRTGDLGRLTLDGEIEFLGRVDGQVKFRGYRIEVGEIEAVLLESDEVANAVVTVVGGESGLHELAAYVAPRLPGARLDDLKGRLHLALSRRLPAYMVPAYIELLDALPTLPSGKADRSRLPAPTSRRLGAGAGAGAPPVTPLEKELAAAWAAVFGLDEVSAEADFFTDLGGDSLIAAGVASRLRQAPGLHHLSIGDLYAHPTVRRLARHLASAGRPASRPAVRPGDPPGAAAPRPRLLHGTARVLACGAAQLALLYLLLAILGLPLALPLEVMEHGASLGPIIVSVAVSTLAVLPLTLLLPLALKWLLVGRFRPGRYPLWGWYFCRWWLVGKALAASPLGLLAGSPLAGLYARLLGARIGKGCHIGTPWLGLPDLIEVGDGASIGYGAVLEPALVEDGWLVLDTVRVGSGAFVGSNAVVMAGGAVGRGARLLEQSLVASGQAIPDGETWSGSPSARVLAGDAQLEEMASRGAAGQICRPGLLAGFAAGFVLLWALPLVLALPEFLVAAAASERGGLALALATSPLAGLVLVLTTCAGIAAVKRAVMPSARPGLYPIASGFGLRKWVADRLIFLSQTTVYTLYDTLYTAPWLRLLGARVGPRAEVSTVAHIDPDLLTLGAESFVADIAAVGPARHHAGLVALGRTELGPRCFVGNGALVPAGRQLGHSSLIGVHSLPPEGPVEPGTSWLGSPAIFLPRRQVSAKFDEERTFRPPARLVACRLAIEALRVVLPPTLTCAVTILMAWASLRLAAVVPVLVLVAVLPALYLAGALLATGLVAGLKWLTVGRYRPRVEPLWSHFVWRTGLITGLYESVADAWLLGWLAGTPWLPPLLRLFGARVGRRVYLDTTWLTEFDLVSVADDAAVGPFTSLQTHLFEDRVMKMSRVTVGPRASVGPRSVVLYDAVVGAGCALDALSLAMKGEALPEETRWRGVPARLTEAAPGRTRDVA